MYPNGIPGFNEPFPSRDAIVKPSRKADDPLVRWTEQSLLERVELTPFRVTQNGEALQVNSSSSTTLGGDQTSGQYRVTLYAEVVTADPVSQSLTLTITWTHNAKPLSRALAAFTGAPMTTLQTVGFTEVIAIDAGTPIGLQWTYASNTPGLGVFEVIANAELVEALA